MMILEMTDGLGRVRYVAFDAGTGAVTPAPAVLPGVADRVCIRVASALGPVSAAELARLVAEKVGQ